MLQQKIQKAREEDGFTLIELLVVILIIGILAAIALPTFLGQSDKAKDSSAKSDARNAVTQIESCLADGRTVAKCVTTAADGAPELGQFKHFVSGYPQVNASGGYVVRTNARSDANSWFQIEKSGASPGGYTYTAGTTATGKEAWEANTGNTTTTTTTTAGS